MEKIKLASPVMLLYGSTNEERSAITDMLKYKKCINFTEGAVRIVGIEEENDNSFIGMDAARMYCTILRHPYDIVDEIDVDDIVKHCEEVYDLFDIMYLLKNVVDCNNKLDTMQCSDAPISYLRRCRSALQSAVEYLAYNCECERPYTDNHGVPIASLCCIDYELREEVEE
ncbi:hypothetical protein ACTQ07_04690 [Holdemanella porci]|uniref:hypothetical protein n=1 Tax=Holdemanella porci TaxID=2652276 RepID=UPI003F8F1A8E